MDKFQFEEMCKFGLEMIQVTAHRIVKEPLYSDQEALRMASVLFRYWATMHTALINTYLHDNPNLLPEEREILNNMLALHRPFLEESSKEDSEKESKC